MFTVERNAVTAAQALVDEFGPNRVAVEEELAPLRAVMAGLTAGQ